MIRFALPLIALSAAACTQARPDGAAAPAPGVECNSNGLESLIGQPRSEALAAEAKRLSGANIVRFLTPDMMVTMEFRADRLNLNLGTDGKVGSARCG
jgi:hypothetical protein